MDDSASMSERDGLADLLENGQESGPFQLVILALLEHPGEAPPLDQLHGEERARVGKRPDTEDRWNSRMLELSGDGGFPAESLLQCGILQVFLLKDLEDHRAAEPLVLGQHDGSHRAF